MSSPSNNSSTSSHSQPNTPTSSNKNYGMKAAFRYDPYNNFAKVYVNNTTPTNSRSNSGSTTPRSVSQQGQQQQQGSFDYNSRYEYSNTKSTAARQPNKDLMDEVVMSYSETPTNRAETEQQLHSKNNNANNKLSSLAPPTPRSHKNGNNKSTNKNYDYSASSCSEDEEHHLHNQMMLSLNNDEHKESQQQQQQVETPRASVRTMQHLLQNVPYLFLDVVAESTVMCREPGHRVGEHISAWSGPVQSLPQYDGQCIRDVFVAQLPFDLPLSCIQMLADLLIEGPRVHILHASPHIKAGRNYDGCCFVKMYEDDANRFIHAMHKRVLFDVDGVWVATTLPELQELTDYCAWFQEQKGEQRKEILKMPTPFSAMTAEFALRGSRANNNNNHHHQHQQHPNNNRNSFHNHGANHHHAVVAAAAPAPAYDQNPHQRHFAQHYNYYAQQYTQQQQQQQHGMIPNGHQLHHQHLMQQQQQYYGGY